MKQLSKRIFLLLFIFFLTGCAVRSVYVPTSQNILLFDDKKQVQANAFIGSNHIELQLAHNPADHFTIGFHTNYGAGLSIYEGALGLYNYSGEDKKWRYELQAGYNYTDNYSIQNHPWFNVFNDTKLNFETISLYSKYSLQPALGYFGKIDMYKLTYSFTISCRASYIYFNRYVYREINEQQSQLQNTTVYWLKVEYKNKNLFLLEPCITNKIGRKNLFGLIQGQFMIPYSKQIDVSYTKFSPVFILSLGIQYNIVFRNQKNSKK